MRAIRNLATDNNYLKAIKSSFSASKRINLSNNIQESFLDFPLFRGEHDLFLGIFKAFHFLYINIGVHSLP